jgi:hypothetical protein
MVNRGCAMRQRVKIAERTKEKKEKTTDTQTCHHYWVIEVANGPRSFGTCKFCGEKKEFLNAFPTYNPLKKGSVFQMPKLLNVKVDKD